MKKNGKNKEYTKLQVPLPKTLRDSAQRVAYKQGYSSLQEVVRVFLTSYSKGKYVPEFEKQSKEYEDYILRITKENMEDIENGEYYVAESGEDITKTVKRLSKDGKL